MVRRMKGQMIVKEHLGGYVEGGDPATFYAELWTWLVKELDIKSVIDVGCGDGVAVKFFEKLIGFGNVLGVDGMPQEHASIVQHDYIEDSFPMAREFDLCWCCEFVEHMDEEFAPNFLETFKTARTVLMTHAAPGQQGHHHVNCRVAEYWRGVMAAIGYAYDEDLTSRSRKHAAKNVNPYNHFVRSGMAFVRN
jgi:SAM-dependent methyltransferase